jgi:Ca2+/Na+ antiporter
VICLVSTLMGLIWTFVLSEMLIDLLNTYIVIAKLDNTYMGLTVIGIGNALPDALTTIELAQHPDSV